MGDHGHDPAASGDDSGEYDDEQERSHAFDAMPHGAQDRCSAMRSQESASGSSETGPASVRTVSIVSASSAVLSSR